LKISLVIPSIGNRNLIPTLRSIVESSIEVDEIIISIPDQVNINKDRYKSFKKLIFLNSKVKGQVAQRIEGFKVAKNDIVVQLDDDIILETECLKLMLAFIKKNNNSAVSAHFCDIANRKSIYDKLNTNKYNFLNYIMNGSKIGISGIITRSGFETYPNFNCDKNVISSEWIPGGCVMHLKKNLVLSNFFPFNGKAYCEDLFHSIALKKNKIKLYYHTNAKAFLEIEDIKSSFKTYIKHLRADLQIRKKLVEQNKLSKSRMYFVYIIKTISYLFR
tara:strand:- start:323 stop:1147 length:825 start_codon:yes stop_codon:yes gene_type:complete